MKDDKFNETNNNNTSNGEVEDDKEGEHPKRLRWQPDKKYQKGKYKSQESGFAPIPLDEFVSDIPELTQKERERIIDQALVLIDDVYVHLPLKRAMHAVDPVQRLKLLKYRSPKLDERTFHNRMISIFTDLRDLHTNYILPSPYKNRVAFLPFLIEAYYSEGKREYMVSKIFEGVGDQQFKEGVVITHWNGIPIDRAAALNGERNAGSNEYARHARGVERMTIRPLMMSLPPDEAWVDITYLEQGSRKVHTARFQWYVTPPPAAPYRSAVESEKESVYTTLGIDIETEIVRRTKKSFFRLRAVKLEEEMQKHQAQEGSTADSIPDSDTTSMMPDVFSFRTVDTAHGTFGYIRIWTFNVDDADDFVNEFIRIAKLLPPNGLIIDVRGNGGGLITAGEKLLQVFTTEKIERERLHFISTPLMQQLCENNQWLSNWQESIERSVETGAIYSQGFPIESDEEYYISDPYKYDGPVVLITDALCYSTTDIFAAGFKDNQLGIILGVDRNTGAGGANVWTHELLQKLVPREALIEPLPRNCGFRVAIRRTTRVGKNVGMPLEDLGVKPNKDYKMKREDLINNNKALIDKAASILAG